MAGRAASWDEKGHMTMATLENAIALAARAHAGQKDKAGQPYILHPLRVMLAVEGGDERMAAVLHDVVEDTDLSLDDLSEQGFDEAVVAAVDCLSRRDGEDYMDFVRRAATDPVSRKVKVADLNDNLDTSRLPEVTDRDQARIERYQAAKRLIEDL